METKVRVEEISDEKVNLKTEAGKDIILPIENAPKNIKIGNEYTFSIFSKNTKEEKNSQAQDILNELLNIDNNENI